ncbi:hypothetical protein OSCT_2956 [Oscillochloris trichoides DG-6]|uniref:Glycosyltransferase RgtA/B/C/D-like domain-containing protein n=1 Tax=Oscillochloris trichoides DG-6 TaxID=765420 RepID=E1II05_9CHLR|nr:hypothetical protein OSCT_2956 [Oscillochloris trichoides DG-6]
MIHPALWLSLLALLIIFLIAPHLPLNYPIQVGYPEGVGSDLPFVQGFNAGEASSYGNYRWTQADSRIEMAGVGRRSLSIEIRILGLSPEIQAVAPQQVAIFANEQHLVDLPVRPSGSRHYLLIPAPSSGQMRLSLRSSTFTPAGDPRQLGLPVEHVVIRSVAAAGFVSPDWEASLGWLGAMLVLWLALRHALGAAVPQWQQASLYAGAVLLVGVTALLDPPHWAAGANAALIASGLAYPLAIILRAAVAPLACRFGVPLSANNLGWLVGFAVIAFTLRYGGRLYPNAMHGDINFHVNRFTEAANGLIYILSKNRGVDFPYPPGPYLVIAPFTLLGLPPSTVLQIGAALVDALSAILIYAIASRITRGPTALLAAATYVFTAATFMTTWWSFDTHIYSQFFHLLCIAALCWAGEAWQGDDQAQRRGWSLALFVLLSLVFLGHFGFLINTTLLVSMLVAVTWIQSWRGVAWARAVRWPLSLTLGGAVLFAGLFFYSAYIPMFLNQLEIARESGMSAVANRAPASRAAMWENLWRAGLITHFGIFPIPLGLIGIGLLARRTRLGAQLSREGVVLAMMLGSLIVAICFAVLPFITLATNSPRWLMFLAWIIAIGTAISSAALWRRGWIGRLAVLLMGAVVVANTAWIWIAPMIWRVRPPEPF